MIMSPPAVLALNSLQKPMILTPCWPSAGPTGGAGFACPAGICHLICPVTFFAIKSDWGNGVLEYWSTEQPAAHPSITPLFHYSVHISHAFSTCQYSSSTGV